MTPLDRWQAAQDHLNDLRARFLTATPPPWRALALGSEGYAVLGPQGSRRGGHPKATPHTARCTHEDWDTDRANAELIAALRNAGHGLIEAAQGVLVTHRPVEAQDVPGLVQCSTCAYRWPCALVEPLLNAFGIRP